MTFFSKWVARRVHQDGAAAEESLGRLLRSSKSESAAHWKPALAAVSEDHSNEAPLPMKKSGKEKPEKKTSGRRGKLKAKSHSYHSIDDHKMSSVPPVEVPPFAWAPFMF